MTVAIHKGISYLYRITMLQIWMQNGKQQYVIFKFQNSNNGSRNDLCLSIPCSFSLNLICKFYKEPLITSITTKQEKKY